MAKMQLNHLVRLRSWLDDYVTEANNGNEVHMRERYSAWPGALSQIWQVRDHAKVERQGLSYQPVLLRSWRGDYLSLDDTGVTVQTTNRINSNAEWDPRFRNDGLTNLRCHFTKEAIYLHRPKDVATRKNVAVGWHKDKATGNNWMVEDLGLPPAFETKPFHNGLAAGHLVRLRAFDGTTLYPNLDTWAVEATKLPNHLPYALLDVWEVCDVGEGYIAFKGINGCYLTAPAHLKTGVHNVVVPLGMQADGKIGDGAGWMPSLSNTGKWEFQNRRMSDQYLHKPSNSKRTGIWSKETSPGNHFTVELYTPTGGRTATAGTNGQPDHVTQHDDWRELIKAPPV